MTPKPPRNASRQQRKPLVRAVENGRATTTTNLGIREMKEHNAAEIMIAIYAVLIDVPVFCWRHNKLWRQP